MCKEDFLCPGCEVFHPLRLSLSLSCYFECAQSLRTCGSGCDYTIWTSPYFPAKIHSNALAAVMRSYRHERKVYPPESL